MGIIGIIIIGFIAGLVARAVLPGRQSMGLILTTALGIGGSLLASYAGQAVGWYSVGQAGGFIAAVIGAVVLLLIYGFVSKKK